MPIVLSGSQRKTEINVSTFAMDVVSASGDDRFLTLDILHYGTAFRDITVLTYAGSSLLPAAVQGTNNGGGLYTRSHIYYLVDPPIATCVLTGCFAGLTSYDAHVATWTGVNASSPVGASSGASAALSSSPQSLVTPASDNSLLLGSVVHSNSASAVPGSGLSSLFGYDNGAWGTNSNYVIQTTAASQFLDWRLASDSAWSVAVAAFNSSGSSNVAPTIGLNTSSSLLLGTLPTLEFTGSDANNDSLRYNIQISAASDFAAGSPYVTDSHNAGGGGLIHPNPGAVLTWEGNYQVDDRPGQSFTGAGGILDNIRVRFSSDVETSGCAFIRIYDHEGAFGTDSQPLNAASPADTPTGSWLAISDSFPFTTGCAMDWREFTFSGSNRIGLEDNQYYVFIIDWIPTTSSYDNTIEVSADAIVVDHPGNVYIDGYEPANNRAWPDLDLFFEVYETILLIDKVSGTDNGFLNTVTGGDTDPFNAGEKISYTVQSEDALVPGIYYWRARTIDPDGSGTYSDWSETRYFEVTDVDTLIIADSTHAHYAENVGAIIGSTVWGHSTGALEDNVRAFSENWTGTGDISGSGDTESVILSDGEYMISEVVNTGIIGVTILQNVYSSGNESVVKYRHAATKSECEVAEWTTYTAQFQSDGYVQVRIEAP